MESPKSLDSLQQGATPSASPSDEERLQSGPESTAAGKYNSPQPPNKNNAANIRPPTAGTIASSLMDDTESDTRDSAPRKQKKKKTMKHAFTISNDTSSSPSQAIGHQIAQQDGDQLSPAPLHNANSENIPQQQEQEQFPYSQTPAAATAADPAELNELEAYLQQPDAIMEPGIINRLSEYLRASGNPRHAVEFLAESYVGYAQMSSLVCSWLKAVDDEEEKEREHGNEHVHAAGKAGGVTAGTVISSNNKNKNSTREHESRLPQKLVELDEAHYLRAFVLERFDPGKFSGIFLAGGGGVPKWLNPLIAEAEGRSLIYDLSATYTNCLLLNFAIQKILLQPGREAEVAAVGTTLVGYFGVFHRLMSAKLRDIAAATTESEIHSLAMEFCDICSQSQHAYVHALLLLQTLSKSEKGSRFKRLSEELEAAAAAKQGSIVYKMRRWFLSSGGMDNAGNISGGDDNRTETEFDVLAAASVVLGDMLASAVVAGGAAPIPDVIKLYRLYFPQHKGTTITAVPPAALLRHPAVFQSLLQGLFSPGRPLSQEAAAAHIGLLAVAAAGDDGKLELEDSPKDTITNTSLVGTQGSVWVNQPPIKDTMTALQVVVSVAHKACRDEAVAVEDLEASQVAMQQAICAAGVLKMLRTQLSTTDAWASSFRSHNKASPLVLLLAFIAKYQPGMTKETLGIVREALSAAGSVGQASCQALLETAATLLAHGYVLPVLDWAHQWANNADPGLIRYLIFQILSRAGAPYSPVFVSAVLRLLGQCGFRKARLAARDWAVGLSLLAEFLEGCGKLSASSSMGLGQKEMLVLKELQGSEMIQKEINAAKK